MHLATTLSTTDAGIAPPVLQTQGFGLCFGSRLILAGLELSLPERGVDVLTGPPLCGKSTLLRALAGRYAADPHCRQWGQVSMAGRPLADGWRPTLVQPQKLVSRGNLHDALILPSGGQFAASPKDWSATAEEALSQHGLASLAKDLSSPVARLTPSRQRAVNILGHAMVGAPLLMVDEPTYGLAEGEALWLVAWMAALGRKSRLLVVLQHQGHARRLADRVVLLGGGRVLAHESAARFFTQPPNSYAAQFVRTGELTIAAPDANPDHLPSGVEPPPALPATVWATLLDMHTKLASGRLEPPTERQVRDFDTQPGEFAESPMGDFGALSLDKSAPSQHADLNLPAPLATPVLQPPSAAVRAASLLPPRADAPPPFSAAASKLSGADFSDTIPGARLDMTPVMPPRAALGPQGLRPAPGEVAPPPGAPALSSRDDWPDTQSSAVQKWSSASLHSPDQPQAAAVLGGETSADSRGPVGFYWWVPGKLAGCAEPGIGGALDDDLRRLARAGVRALITLTETSLDPAALARNRLIPLHVPLADRHAPTIAQVHMLAIRIQRLIDQGLTVAVHCSAGVDRTGVVLAAWMIREGGYGAASALERLRRVNPAHEQTQGQEDFLLAFEQDLRRRTL